MVKISGKGIFQSAKELRQKQDIQRDDESIIYLELFNTKDWGRNNFQVTHQTTVEGKYTNRYDVTILINGLPLVQIELKRRGIDMKEAFNQITKQTLESCYLSIPSIEEQEKISNTLKLLDRKIELQSKKIEGLKLFKKGLFNNITYNESNIIKLGDILEEISEKSTVNNQHDILSSTANGLFLQKEYFNKQAASENNIGYKILKRNQLVLSPQNLWMGNININTKYDIGIVSPSYKIFNIDSKIINIDFFNNWIKSSRALYEYMISSEQGASIVRRNLNIDMFYEITINAPSIEKQNKIGSQIKNVNKKIDLEIDKLEKLNELKKGLTQNMFV